MSAEVEYYTIHFAYSEDDGMRQLINREIRRNLEALGIKRYSLRINPQLGNLQLRLKPNHYAMFALKWNPNNLDILDYYPEARGPAVNVRNK